MPRRLEENFLSPPVPMTPYVPYKIMGHTIFLLHLNPLFCEAQRVIRGNRWGTAVKRFFLSYCYLSIEKKSLEAVRNTLPIPPIENTRIDVFYNCGVFSIGGIDNVLPRHQPLDMKMASKSNSNLLIETTPSSCSAVMAGGVPGSFLSSHS